MKIQTNYNLSVDDRVRKAISGALQNYLNKLMSGYLDIELEASFKMHLAALINESLQLSTYYTDERFSVSLEKNIPINQNNSYVDIVINYQNGQQKNIYLIELKFKKITDSAPDLGVIGSFIDMFNLDSQKQNSPNVHGCYFIFLTDLATYKNKPKANGTRKELPMEDGAVIKKNTQYIVTGKTAKKNTIKFPNGFVFSKTHSIVYTEFYIQTKPFWYFLLEI